MEIFVKLAWGLLALIHAPPAVVFFAPTLLRRLYGVEPGGDVGVLLMHRGALFMALVVLCLQSIVDAPLRRGGSLAVAISMAGFLFLYARSGFPAGALRTIAIADTVALAPLLLVLVAAWGLG
ncbi:MAG: hypothetical protein MUF64_26830 [Polyangiaceae bacterium]|jgi:hypothetical protein|nr:hypothetical protein [Polyangiaceae bacterium]